MADKLETKWKKGDKFALDGCGEDRDETWYGEIVSVKKATAIADDGINWREVPMNEIRKIREDEMINRFIEKLDQLCFEYKYELIPVFDINKGAFIKVRSDYYPEEAMLHYIDGDGRGE